MPEFLHGDLTERIIGAAMEVHSTLGAGYVEKFYEKALAYELELHGIKYQRQLQVPIYYKELDLGIHRLDLLVEGKVVVELKSVSTLLDVHYSFVRSYLTATRCMVGLLLNFGKAKLEHRRVEAVRG